MKTKTMFTKERIQFYQDAASHILDSIEAEYGIPVERGEIGDFLEGLNAFYDLPRSDREKAMADLRDSMEAHRDLIDSGNGNGHLELSYNLLMEIYMDYTMENAIRDGNGDIALQELEEDIAMFLQAEGDPESDKARKALEGLRDRYLAA